MTDELDSAHMIKQPFRSYTLDEERQDTTSETLNIRINKQERALLDELKAIYHYSQDAKVIKLSLMVCRNVTQSTFGSLLMQKLTDGERRRPVTETLKEADKNSNL